MVAFNLFWLHFTKPKCTANKQDLLCIISMICISIYQNIVYEIKENVTRQLETIQEGDFTLCFDEISM